MKKSSIRAFGIACFLIGASLFLIEKIGTEATDSKTIDETKYEEKIASLEQQLNEANDQIAKLQQAGQPENTNDEATEEQETEQETNPQTDVIETSDEVIEATLHIYSGLTGYEIGKKLEDLGIVKNGLELELYLAKPEFAKYIQIGQFELNSSMSIDEIAKIITGKE